MSLGAGPDPLPRWGDVVRFGRMQILSVNDRQHTPEWFSRCFFPGVLSFGSVWEEAGGETEGDSWPGASVYPRS